MGRPKKNKDEVEAVLTNESIVSRKSVEGNLDNLKRINEQVTVVTKADENGVTEEKTLVVEDGLVTEVNKKETNSGDSVSYLLNRLSDDMNKEIDRKEWEKLGIPDDITKRDAELSDEEKFPEGFPEEGQFKEGSPEEAVHILGYNVVLERTPINELGRKGPYVTNVEFPIDEEFTEKVTMEPSNIFPPDEEPIPDVEDEGIDPDEVIDSLVTRRPFVLAEDLVMGGDTKAYVENTKVYGNPRAGQTAKNAAVRNVFVPNADGKATNAPRISSTATGTHKKPATIKSVEGGRSGMFRIDANRPIKN